MLYLGVLEVGQHVLLIPQARPPFNNREALTVSALLTSVKRGPWNVNLFNISLI